MVLLGLLDGIVEAASESHGRLALSVCEYCSLRVGVRGKCAGGVGVVWR